MNKASGIIFADNFIGDSTSKCSPRTEAEALLMVMMTL